MCCKEYARNFKESKQWVQNIAALSILIQLRSRVDDRKTSKEALIRLVRKLLGKKKKSASHLIILAISLWIEKGSSVAEKSVT